MTFHLVNMQILKEGLFLAYFTKPLQQNALYLQGLNTVFIIVYSFLHVVTFDLIIGLNDNLSFGQHANTEGGHVPCLPCKTFAAKCLFLQGLSMVFYDCLHILHLLTFDLILLALIMIFHLRNIQTLKTGIFRVLTQQNICRKMP